MQNPNELQYQPQKLPSADCVDVSMELRSVQAQRPRIPSDKRACTCFGVCVVVCGCQAIVWRRPLGVHHGADVLGAQRPHGGGLAIDLR